MKQYDAVMRQVSILKDLQNKDFCTYPFMGRMVIKSFFTVGTYPEVFIDGKGRTENELKMIVRNPMEEEIYRRIRLPSKGTYCHELERSIFHL